MRIERIPFSKTCEIDEDIDISLIDSVLKIYENKKKELIPALQEVQKIYGYLPKKAMKAIAHSLKISASEVYGVATFYSQFSLNPKGKHIIKVCTGTACHVTGSKKLADFIHEKLKTSKNNNTTQDGLFTFETVSCLGACGLAPVVVIDEKVYGEVTLHRCEEIIDNLIAAENNQL